MVDNKFKPSNRIEQVDLEKGKYIYDGFMSTIKNILENFDNYTSRPDVQRAAELAKTHPQRAVMRLLRVKIKGLEGKAKLDAIRGQRNLRAYFQEVLTPEYYYQRIDSSKIIFDGKEVPVRKSMRFFGKDVEPISIYQVARSPKLQESAYVSQAAKRKKNTNYRGERISMEELTTLVGGNYDSYTQFYKALPVLGTEYKKGQKITPEDPLFKHLTNWVLKGKRNTVKTPEFFKIDTLFTDKIGTAFKVSTDIPGFEVARVNVRNFEADVKRREKKERKEALSTDEEAKTQAADIFAGWSTSTQEEKIAKMKEFNAEIGAAAEADTTKLESIYGEIAKRFDLPFGETETEVFYTKEALVGANQLALEPGVVPEDEPTPEEELEDKEEITE